MLYVLGYILVVVIGILNYSKFNIGVCFCIRSFSGNVVVYVVRYRFCYFWEVVFIFRVLRGLYRVYILVREEGKEKGKENGSCVYRFCLYFVD